MNLTVVSAPLAVRQPASGETHSHGVTGGVYKTRERIHRDIADPRLLAIPTSCSRVADCNPDYDALSGIGDRKSTRLNSSHSSISYAVFCLKKQSHAADSILRRRRALGTIT